MIINVPANFTLDELLAHLRAEAEPGQAEGYCSTADWARRFDVSEKRMRDILGEAKAQGKLLCRQVRRERLDGSAGRLPVYAFDLSEGEPGPQGEEP